MRRHGPLFLRIFLTACCLGGAEAALAGVGGENMLLVVNPNDPASLQIANAYAGLRHIPASNMLFIAPPSDYINNGAPITQTEHTNTYLTPIAAPIAARGDLTISGTDTYSRGTLDLATWSAVPGSG